MSFFPKNFKFCTNVSNLKKIYQNIYLEFVKFIYYNYLSLNLTWNSRFFPIPYTLYAFQTLVKNFPVRYFVTEFTIVTRTVFYIPEIKSETTDVNFSDRHDLHHYLMNARRKKIPSSKRVNYYFYKELVVI